MIGKLMRNAETRRIDRLDRHLLLDTRGGLDRLRQLDAAVAAAAVHCTDGLALHARRAAATRGPIFGTSSRRAR